MGLGLSVCVTGNEVVSKGPELSSFLSPTHPPTAIGKCQTQGRSQESWGKEGAEPVSSPVQWELGSPVLPTSWLSAVRRQGKEHDLI